MFPADGEPATRKSPSGPEDSTVVAVEYDRRGRRVGKVFDDPCAARRFYCAKFKAGKNPRVQDPASEPKGLPEEDPELAAP